MPTYNKLVRDKIPKIISESGKQYTIETIQEKDYDRLLKEKFWEETKELMDAATQEEFLQEAADILEVLHALIKLNDATVEQVEKIREEKKRERGGFEKRIFLKEVKK
ncbi:nucleoside triphosphate pyrophosphohydrolase [Radiobacillus kanasensis]|uniref:nucleoside triphosphate pyrophosphohydrolase n=1 Tax=Radiobacillus kanasensis TaxID=2844358 RepID=UPI001E4999D1|nr:nucleoside triphosphate pyrophosphohydrolase [Radiobacillus kanasensis]UFU00752.1 nucleoside triphosphate pyrophosphohydrolase [Radiobacillus kanasensis]